MALFDSLIREATGRFSLGTRGGALLRELVAFMLDDKGGVAGFLERFNGAGLGNLVASWLGPDENLPLTAEHVERALGKDVITLMARKTGLPVDTALAALAFYVPRVVDMLTPDSDVPETVPAEIRIFAGGGSTTAARLAGPVRGRRPSVFGRWWLWALLLAFVALGVLVSRLYDRVTETPSPAATRAWAAAVKPKLSISNQGSRVDVVGVVRDESTRASILDSLKAAFGEGNVQGDVRVDPAADPASWTAKLKAALESLKAPGADLQFEGSSIGVGGLISDVEQSALLESLKSLFGGEFSFTLLGDKAAEVFRAASERTLNALAGLKPGYRPEDLVTVLNLSIINFETGSARITADNADVLQTSAARIRDLPAGSVIEIGGHTDSTGDPAANMVLSHARAEAVRRELVRYGVDPAALVARGYGDTRPIADNDTPNGRFQNRRIEFAVLR